MICRVVTLHYRCFCFLAVSFSIKVKEEEVTSLKTRTALLYESSGDEDEDGSSGSEATSLASRSLPHSLSRSSLASTATEKPAGNSEELEKKQAGQKLADRLAAAAREKLARESKERQLQAQRKRKAAMFINMLKDIDGTTAPNSGAGATGTGAPAEDGGTDGFGGSVDSPFGSSLASRSVTPTLFLEQVTSTLNATVMSVQPVVSVPTTAKLTSATVTPSRSSHSSKRRSRSRSRDRDRRPSRRHRKHSHTPPTAYTLGRRPASKSPTSAHQHHRSHSQSKHKPKHSRGVHSTSHSHAESKARRMDGVVAGVDRKRKSRSHSGDRKLKKEPGLKKSSNKSHKKKSSKDEGTSHRHKSKKHKSKSKHRRSLSSSPEDQQPSKRRSKSTVDRNNPDVVDLTGSPRAEDIGSRFAC